MEGWETILIPDPQYWYQAEDFILGLPKPEPMQKKDKKEIYQHDLSGCVWIVRVWVITIFLCPFP